MRALPWIIAGVGIGAGITILLLSQSQSEYATGYDRVEDVAHKAFNWGTKQRAEGKGRSFVGAVKEGIGHVAGDADLANAGTAERVVGDIKDAAGQVGHAVGETIHDLNR